MLYQIYNDCLGLIKASGRMAELAQLQQLPETTTPSAAIEAMNALVNKIKKHTSLAPDKKGTWEDFSNGLEIAQSFDLISQTNMFDEIKAVIQQEFPAPAPTPQEFPIAAPAPRIQKKAIFKASSETIQIDFSSRETETEATQGSRIILSNERKEDDHIILNNLEKLYMFYQQVEKNYKEYNNSSSGSSSSSSSSSSSDQRKTDEQKIRYMRRIALTMSSQILQPFFETNTFEKFKDLKNKLEQEEIKNSIPLLLQLGLILADPFELPAPLAAAPQATAAPVMIMDFQYKDNDPLAYYKSLYKEYMEVEDLLSAIPAANDYHQGPLVQQNFESADLILVTLLNYAKKLDLSFLEGFIEESLYKRLCLQLDNIKKLNEETATREQLFVPISAFSMSVTPVLKILGAQLSLTFN